MSGFFAIRRETFTHAEQLTPLGYKIALELMCKGRVRNVCEIPISFGTRQRGRSKLTLVQQFRYLEHLSRLYDYTFPRLSPIVKFLIALGCAWMAGLFVFLILRAIDFAFVRSLIVSYIAAIAVTAIFHLRYVRTQREFLVRPTPWRDFALISLAELVACTLAALWLRRIASEVHELERFVIAFGCATVVRYVLRKELLQDIRGYAPPREATQRPSVEERVRAHEP